ncbi:hypothetical protein [Streptomyces sp. NPDC059708]|uniref:hypothetical protein n=1 Tax=Streptomyces sp. NPDC059708 TaxID=3346916 RepID=UPI0036B340CC
MTADEIRARALDAAAQALNAGGYWLPADGQAAVVDAVLQSASGTVRSIQAAAWQNKLAKGFNTTDVPLEFGLLTAEVGEAFTAWRKGLPDAGEELADILLYLVALAEMTGVDLQDAVHRKMAINAARVYQPSAVTGALIREDAATTT